jgi:predicted ATPase
MSDGTLRALAALVAAFQIILPSGPGVVGIEEPETALHPAAMRALVDALDEATLRTQILLTTHSAELLDNPTIKPENVRVVQLLDGKTVIGPVDEASVEIVARKLSTLGGLERENQLEPDLDDQERQRDLSQNGEKPQG